MTDDLTATDDDVRPLTWGRSWQQLPQGLRFRTCSRTVTEADFIQFITWAGFTEPLFFDASTEPAGNARRLVPAAMTYAIVEGLIIQTQVFLGTGVAFLGMELAARRPVYVGDTVHAVVTVTESRSTKNADRGLVVSTVVVRNQRGEDVLEYTPKRLISSETTIER